MTYSCRWKRPCVFGAYETSRNVRIVQLIIAITYCSLSSGIIFGYAALKPILISEGVYSHLCMNDEVITAARVCDKQELRLNFMFTVSAIASNLFALPSGAILDKYGPRFTGGVGAILLAMGSLLFATASHFPYDRHLFGYTLMAMGGVAVFISSFHLSNSFPKHSGIILSILTGAFDLSSALFLLFRRVHGANASLKFLFLLYLTIPGLILISQVFLMPSRPYSTVGELIAHAQEILAEEMEHDRANVISGFEPGQQPSRYRHTVEKIKGLLEEEDYDHIKNVWKFPSVKVLGQRQNTGNHLWGILHTLPASEQIGSWWFILLAAFAMGQFLRINYFISTLRVQYDYLLSSPALARSLNQLFDCLLPLGGIINAPFVGLFLDYTTLPFMLFILVGTTTIIGFAGCISNSLTMGYINIILFTLYRPYFYTAVSDYTAKIFGFQTFGKVYGLVIFAASIGSFLQTPLEMITLREFNGDPVPINVLLTAGTFLAGGVLTLFVWHKSNVYRYSDLTPEVDIEPNYSILPVGRPSVDIGDDSAAAEERDVGQTDPLLHPLDKLGSSSSSYGAIL
ncbi:FMP42 [Nannizzia gypsea CBS 118893]|uniref:FMP42 n=1 Tax=Arthroderma gypseum (strain ATCC MYA-4604 / CBS 118893) TaxID=535722 RepID=E4UP23_ARTGP|nr:FMP42 [Nannizzia gypsea CBS 118893]EFQ99776.1 FMP42 [Nannizzia gypsea CBS 118893]